MGSYQYIDFSGAGAGDDIFCLAGGFEPVEYFDDDGEICEPLGECPSMLDAEDRRRCQYRDLSSAFYGFEGRSHFEFGLAVTDVTAEEPVHCDWYLHVGLDLLGGGDLVWCFLVWEGFLEFDLPVGVLWVSDSIGILSFGLYFQEFSGQVLYGVDDFFLLSEPSLCSDFA